MVRTAYSKYRLFNSLVTVIYCEYCFVSLLPQSSWTALMLASVEGHTDVVQLLLSSGAQVNLKHMVRHEHQLDSYVSLYS